MRSEPLTGTEYLDSIRDGRSIIVNGTQVGSPLEVASLASTARTYARLYDALHDEEQSELLTREGESGARTHRFFLPDKTIRGLVASRDAIAHWQRSVHGWLGRTPDYKAAIFGMLGVCADAFGEYAENARRWHDRACRGTLFMGHVISSHRFTYLSDFNADLSIVKETAEGIYLSGVKGVATSVMYTHFSFLAHSNLEHRGGRYSLVCIVPTNAPGFKIASRRPYAGKDFAHPLAARFDENDAIVVLDSVFVPYENILVFGATESARGIFASMGFSQRYSLHSCTRLATKMDFIAGLLVRLADLDSDTSPGMVQLTGEIMGYRHLFWSLSEAMVRDPRRVNGYLVPSPEASLAYRNIVSLVYPELRKRILEHLRGRLIFQPSSEADLQHSVNGSFQAKAGTETGNKISLIDALWDVSGTEFGSRHELYELNFSGGIEAIRKEIVASADFSGLGEFLRTLIDEYLVECSAPEQASTVSPHKA